MWVTEWLVARRWVRFEMPVMVCVEVDEQVEDARVVTVVVGTDEEDITLARDAERAVLVYDESMERVSASEPIAAEAVSVAEDRAWPEQAEWEFGPDRPAVLHRDAGAVIASHDRGAGRIGRRGPRRRQRGGRRYGGVLHRVEGRTSAVGAGDVAGRDPQVGPGSGDWLPEDLFTDTADKRLTTWRARAVAEYPSTLRRDHPRAVRLTLLAVLCWCRATEITDSLVELFIQLVHRINVRAERRVEREMIAEFRRGVNKETVLFRLAEAAVDHPDERVRQALYPVVGEGTLRDLVTEAKATEAARRARVRTVLEGSYSHHYRAMLPKLLDALDFRCNNTAYRPVMDAVNLLHRYKDRDGRAKYYDPTERVPLDGVVRAEGREAVVDARDRVERVPYELCALGALRDAIRRREAWVAGAGKWRNPETDLPHDFDLNRDLHYEAIRQPLDPTEFVTGLKTRLDAALIRLSTALATGTTGGVKLGTRHGGVWITVPKRAKQPEPERLAELKNEVIGRWGMVSLLDVLKEADWLTGLHREFTTNATREHILDDELRRRILLVLFGLGTNIGIRRVVTSGDHGVTEAQLRRLRRNYLTRDGLRRASAAVVGETLRTRNPAWWGQGTACASDSKKFGPGRRT